MTPTQVVNERLWTLLGADTVTMQWATPVVIQLIKEPFTPASNLTPDDVVFADFTGSDPISATGAPQPESIDGNNGDVLLDVISSSTMGWRWETTNTANLPQTIYGYVVTDLADAVTLGSALFDTPITLNGVGLAVDIPQVRYTFVPSPLS